MLVEGEGTGRKEDGASGHMQNPVFEELKACYICKISKKKTTQGCFCILGSGQCSHAPEAWAGLREALEGVPAIALHPIPPCSHRGENWGTVGTGSAHDSRGLGLIPAPAAFALAVVGGVRSW